MTHKDPLENTSISTKNTDNSINNKEHRFATGGIISVKESDSGNLVVKGYIATTHPDAVKDIITKEALETWAKEINDGVPRANKVTYHHDRNDVRVVGVGVKGTARVEMLPDGHYGLYCETIVNKAHELYNEIEYEYKIGALDSFSIEYVHEGTKEGEGRILDANDTKLYGWTLASRPVNENAVMIKELINRKEQESDSLNRSSESDGLEEKTMSEEKIENPVISEAELKELQELKEYKKKMEEEKKAKDAAEKKQVEEEEKKKQEAESKEALKKEVLADILESKEFSDALDKQAEKPQMENKEQPQLSVEVKELKTVFENKEASPSRQILAATKFALSKVAELKELNYKVDGFKGTDAQSHVIADGTTMSVEFKSLGLADNLSPASSAALEGGHQHADLREALDAAIVNLLNDNVSYYDFVRKVNKSGSGSDRALFIVRNGRNPTVGAYSGNSVSTGQSSRRKFGTAFKKYQVGVAIDGDMIAANKGAQYDVLATEIEAATLDLKKEINIDAYTEQGLETGEKIIGLEFVADGEGNGTLYGETRSAANGLKYATGDAAKSYASGAAGSLKSNLRTMIRHILVDGGNAQGIKIFMSPLQHQRLVEAEENALRYAPSATTVGIGGPLKLDGKYDIISDVDCPDAKVFVVDMSTVEMQFWVTPTFEPLGKRSDSEEGFIKTYVAHCFKAPRRVTMLHSVPTTV